VSLQRFPIELHAVARRIRGNGTALLEPKRLGDVAVEPESVGLQIRAVRHRREQVNGNIVRAVRRYRQVEGLCEMAPDRVTAAVLQNPIGLHENRATWDDAVRGFSKKILAEDPTLTEDVIQTFGRNMFGGDFVFSVSRDFVKTCRTPLYLQPGTDTPHPAETSAEIASLAPNLEVQKDWRGPEHLAESIRRVTDFLAKNTPKA